MRREGGAAREMSKAVVRTSLLVPDVPSSTTVRGGGLEPPLLTKPDPKSGASTSSAIPAREGLVDSAKVAGAKQVGLGVRVG
jgi:hypothetical protein